MIRPSMLALAAVLAVSAAGYASVSLAAAPPAIAAAIADTGRPADQVARDAARKPAEIMAFAGVKPGMKVIELGAGGGYYTRLLSKAVGANGKVYVIASKAQAARPNGLDGLNAIAAAYPNVSVVVADLNAISVPEPVDMAWTAENYHDFHNGPTADIAGLNKAIYAALKPGGVFFVEDHSAAKGAGLEATSKVHRMDEDVAKAELTAAGFKIDGESNALRNPNDNKAAANSEAGHFASDRFAIRAKK